MSDTTTYWVCTPCIMLAANGPDDETPADALTLVPPFHHSSPGLVTDEHVDPEECQRTADAGDQCGCEYRSFVTRPCEGCGNPYAGERHALTVDDMPRGVVSVWADSFGVWHVRANRPTDRDAARQAILEALEARGNGSEDFAHLTLTRTAHGGVVWRESWTDENGGRR